jgi:F5/8 type C domain
MRTWLHDSSEAYPEREIPILSDASVAVTSEAEGHPIAHIFDDDRGPGAKQWVAAEAGDQTVSITFHHPQTIRRVTLEVEEREAARTQEVQLCTSSDGGETYRELRRQEFTFSPDGATWECEDWAVVEFHVTHVKLIIKPDKGRTDCFAKLTSLVMAD